MPKFLTLLLLTLLPLCVQARTWTADNGNGTFTNPLFFDEFSDPDMIRVGEDFYLTGTTMHAMPGLPVMHSRDLVNWKLLGYACEGLNYGPEYRLEGGRDIYGQGIWAPSFRHHKGTFYIFTNVNRRKTQVFTAKNPAGPWTQHEMKCSLHDLSVLFDDDGKIWVVWGYQDLHLAQLNAELDDLIPGTERIITRKDQGMGEGAHLYKIDGRYYITSAWYAGRMRMPCARAERPEGPWEVNPEISADEEFGIIEGYRLRQQTAKDVFEIVPPNPTGVGRMSLHQGGIIDTAKGEWWGFSMMDANSVGRLTSLSPVTWKDGWPYFGLPGNLGRTPRTWVKPNTGHSSAPSAPYERNDAFDAPQFSRVWQWNHMPVAGKWSLTERPGQLRLRALPASDFFRARNTLTQRAVGPVSIPTTTLDASGLALGDIAGLALLNAPYAWVGVTRVPEGLELRTFDQRTRKTASQRLEGTRVWLRAHCDYLSEKARLSYSTDGKLFKEIGDEITLVYQLRTFQGVRYSLFCYNEAGREGGHADFDDFSLEEPRSTGFTTPIPEGRVVILQNLKDDSVLAVRSGKLAVIPGSDSLAGKDAARFLVKPLGLGRVALRSVADGRFLTVSGSGETAAVSLAEQTDDDSQEFQWTEMPQGDILLLSLRSHRHLCIKPDGTLAADAPGVRYDRSNGASFKWRE